MRIRRWTAGLLAVASCRTPTDAAPAAPAEVIIPSVPCATTLGTFGGLQWTARTDAMAGPGPNRWSPCNTWLDSAGLHLRIDRQSAGWTSAEVVTTTAAGYGRYEFEITTRLDALDPNVVLGLFTYPGGTLDGKHEIDVEFARFGSTAANSTNLNYVVYPATTATTTRGQCSVRWDAAQGASVHRFLWAPGSVTFQSFSNTTIGANTVPYRAWKFVPTGSFAISSGSWPLRMNLWLYGGSAPMNGQPVEVVIRRVLYSTSLPATTLPPTACP